jgi:hypothetical protein
MKTRISLRRLATWRVVAICFAADASSANGSPLPFWANYHCPKYEAKFEYYSLKKIFYREYGFNFPHDVRRDSYDSWNFSTVPALDCSKDGISCLKEQIPEQLSNVMDPIKELGAVIYAAPAFIPVGKSYTAAGTSFYADYWVTQAGFGYEKQAVIYATPPKASEVGPYKLYFKAGIGIVAIYFSKLPSPVKDGKEGKYLTDITCILQSEKGLFWDNGLRMKSLGGFPD